MYAVCDYCYGGLWIPTVHSYIEQTIHLPAMLQNAIHGGKHQRTKLHYTQH